MLKKSPREIRSCIFKVNTLLFLRKMHWALRHTLIFTIISLSVLTLSNSFSAKPTARDNLQTTQNDQNSEPEHLERRRSFTSSRGVCGTADPSPELRDVHKRLSQTEYRQFAAIDGSGINTSRTTSELRPARIEVETWFHVISTNEKVNLVTNMMIASQVRFAFHPSLSTTYNRLTIGGGEKFAYLQQAYQNTSIHYKLMGVDRNINDTWARNGDSEAMKRTLRRGSYRALNIYFQTDLQLSDSTGTGGGSHRARARARARGQGQGQGHYHGNSHILFERDSSSLAGMTSTTASQNLLGFCTLPNPDITNSSSFDDYFHDGCNILASTMPGGSITHYNRGGTTVHEVGHWHGLLHTFQGETCVPGADGDFISDTPQQSFPTEGCPASQDSCPDLPGLDAISNFMDYSSDDCYQSFTTVQGSRMRSMWATMREGK